MHRSLPWMLPLCPAACAGDGGAGESGGSETGTVAASSDDGSADTSTSGGSTGGGMFTASAFTDSQDGSTTGPPPPALLVFPGRDPFDFDFEDIGDTDIVGIEVLNVGGAAATALGPTGDLVDPFAFTGGAYPGDLGNCGDVLEAGETCVIHIVFTPTTLGDVIGTVSLQYEGGASDAAPDVTTLTLLAEGRGTTRNLVEDPGFETCAVGSAPLGFDQEPSAHWTCEGQTAGVDPHGGAHMLAVTTPDPGPFSMTHRVDLSSFGPVIEGGQVTGDLSVWLRTLDDDQTTVAIRYLDAGRTVLDAFVGPAATAADWTETVDERPVPAATVAAEIEVQCLPQTASCEAFVDDVVLTLTR